MIPLFVGYAMLVWVFAARHRRQVAGFTVVLLGLIGLVGLNWLHSMLNEWSGGSINLPVLRAIMYPYSALVVAVGLFIAVLPRRSLTGCYRCAYELDGLEVVGGAVMCPECGESNQIPTAYRRSGVDREDPGASDHVARRYTAPDHTVGSAAQGVPDAPGREDDQRQPGDQPPAQGEQPAL